MLPRTPPGGEPVFLRFPVVVEDPAVKAALMKRLAARGINVSQMYEPAAFEAVCKLAGRRRACPEAEYLCRRMVNLPTHPYLTARELEEAVAAFHEVFG